MMNDAQHVREDLRTHLLPRKRQLTQQRDQLKAELQAANTVLVEHTNDHVGASSEPAPQGMVVVLTRDCTRRVDGSDTPTHGGDATGVRGATPARARPHGAAAAG